MEAGASRTRTSCYPSSVCSCESATVSVARMLRPGLLSLVAVAFAEPTVSVLSNSRFARLSDPNLRNLLLPSEVERNRPCYPLHRSRGRPCP